MSATSARAASISCSREWTEAPLERGQDAVLVVVARTAMMKGKPNVSR